MLVARYVSCACLHFVFSSLEGSQGHKASDLNGKMRLLN
jgi:hypothetical protein